MDNGFETTNLGVQHAFPVRGECKVATPLVVFVGGRPLIRLHDQIDLFEFPQQSVQRRRPETNLAVGSLGDLLHDAVAMPGSVCDRQQDVENLGFERQQRLDASQPVRHGITPAKYGVATRHHDTRRCFRVFVLS